MNQYIQSQILAMTNYVKTFEQACDMAATKDDGVIDRTEEKQLKQIHAVAEKFIKDLQKIK